MNLRFSIKIFGRVMTILCLALLAWSCVKDTTTGGSIQELGIPVKVEISFRVPKFIYPQSAMESRSAVSDASFHVDMLPESASDETSTRATEGSKPLYNLWVFQFDKDGVKLKAIHASTTEKPIYENQTIEVELLTGTNQTIYLLSLGKQYGDIDFSDIKNISELEATSFNFVRYENGIPVSLIQNDEDVPYGGLCKELSIIKLDDNGAGYIDYRNSSDFTGSIGIRALVSLVSIDLSYQVDKFTPFSISLNNVPTTFVVNDDKFKPSQFVNLPATLLTSSDLSGGKRSTFKWYVPSNPQGVVSTITKESDRYRYYAELSASWVGSAPNNGTYIHFWASDNVTSNKYALYSIFIGSNTTNDFNILPNGHYRYRTDINSVDSGNDKRIVYQTLAQTVDMAASSFTTGIPPGARSGDYFDFDMHSSMRPMEITALRGNFTVEILAGKDDVTPVNAEDSWLKLSTYPNYTAALQGKQSGDPLALGSSATFDVKVPGLFRLYLYNDENPNYLSNEKIPTDNAYKRTMYVRFTFRTSPTDIKTYVARMDQRPGYYIGRFGGDIVNDGTQSAYQYGLVVEAMQESDNFRMLKHYADNFSLFTAYCGSNRVSIFNTDEEIISTGGYEAYNGRESTIMMAENRTRMPEISLISTVEKPRYINGHVDLYQYKYYNLDGFAQRWCYDKNRDTNGNGYLDNDEIVWYMPAAYQTLFVGLNYYNNVTSYLNTFATVVSNTTLISGTQAIAYRVTDFDNVSRSAPIVRCVKNVPIDTNAPGGVTYYEKDGYAVIDASGLMGGVTENRVKNPSFFETVEVDGVTTYTGSVKRHYLQTKAGQIHEMEQKVSVRFRVAPRDINVSGQLVNTKTPMTWAEAAGYIYATNTLPVSEQAAVANTGCPAYTGLDGTQDPTLGKWRLPTLREGFLIALMDKAMADDNAVTGYTLLYNSNASFGANYWTAAELVDESSGGNQNLALAIGNNVSNVSTVKIKQNPSIRVFRSRQKEAFSYYNYYARCIQDLP